MGPNYKAIWLHSHDHYYAFPSLWPVSMNQTSSGPSLEMTSGDEFFSPHIGKLPCWWSRKCILATFTFLQQGQKSAAAAAVAKNLKQLGPKMWSSWGGKTVSCTISWAQPALDSLSTPFHVNEVKVKGWLLVWCQFFFEPEHLPVEGWLVCKMGIEDSIHCKND